ncbi:MAG: hypothetical protein ACC682_06175 [Gemmatimonadota bacterium]
MVGLILLMVVTVGLYRRGGRRFEWSRASLRRATAGISRKGERLVSAALRRLPAVSGQCLADMRGRVDDLLSLLHPNARKQIEERARGIMARAERGASIGQARSARLAAAGQSGVRRYRRLQQRYLEGSITLDRYVEEVQRLQPPG